MGWVLGVLAGIRTGIAAREYGVPPQGEVSGLGGGRGLLCMRLGDEQGRVSCVCVHAPFVSVD